MITFWNTNFKSRSREWTQVVAIKADHLPKGYDPKVWKANGMQVTEGIELKRLGITYQNGERFEEYGYL